MIRKSTSTVALSSLVLLFALSSPETGSAQSQLTAANHLYDVIRANEPNFPFPKAYDTINVGTFNPQTGIFTGLHSIETTDPVHHRTINRPPNVPSGAVRSKLKFTLSVAGGPFSVTVNGKTFAPIAGSLVVYADADVSSNVTWALKAGTASQTDKLIIMRNHIIAVGAITIKYLPLIVCYAPPQNPAGGNSCAYAASVTAGTSLRLTNSSGSSMTKSTMTTATQFLQLINRASGMVDKYSTDPRVKLVASTLQTISGEFGSQSNIVSYGESHDGDLLITHESVDARQITVGNSPANGPGQGDEFVFLQNVKALWTVIDGDLFYCLLKEDDLGYSQLGASTIRQSSDPARRNMLLVDPFCGNSPEFNEPRFTRVIDPISGLSGPIIMDGSSPLEQSLSVQDVTTRTSTSTSFETETTESHSGLFHYLGFGYDDFKTEVDFKSALSSGTSDGSLEVAKIIVSAPMDSIWKLQLYFDNAFGTIVVKRLPIDPMFTVSTGTLIYKTGGSVPGRLVHIQVGAESYSVVTDRNGNFPIYSKGLTKENNPVTLRVGKISKLITVRKNVVTKYAVAVPADAFAVTHSPALIQPKQKLN